MNKITLRFIFLALLVAASSAFAAKRAVEINIGGIGPAADEAAMATIKQVIGQAVANGVIDNVSTNAAAIPIEGGFSVCAQASPYTKNFPFFIKQLKAITPNKNTTAYSLKLVQSCSEEVTFCTQDAQICPDGSYVGRVPPSCAFAPCPTVVTPQ